MIKNIEDLKETIKDYTEEEQKEITELIKPFFDFSDFMLKNHGKNMDDVENESAKYSEEVLPDYLNEFNSLDVSKESSMKFIIGLSGKIYRKYAETYKYPDAEKVEDSLTKYMEIIMKNTLSENGKQ